MNKYFNPRLLNAVIAGTGMKHPVRPHVVLGDQANGFIRGDLMDANAIVEIADQKIKELVNAAPEALDTLKELADALNDDSNFAANIIAAINQKQDTLISGENIKTINGSSILGEGNIVLDTSTYKGLPETWDTTHSMTELIASINADSNAVPGKSYLGTVQLSDLPAGMMQAELIIDIMDQLGTDGDKVIVFSLSSADISPYKWEYTSAYGRLGAWRSWVIEQQQADWNQVDTTAKDYIKNKPTIPTVPTNVSSFNNDAGYLTSHQDISGKEDKVEVVNYTPVPSNNHIDAEFGKCYVFDNLNRPLGTFNFLLPAVTNANISDSIVFVFTTSSTPNLTISSADNTEIRYFNGYMIDPATTYELNFMFNGTNWIVAYGKID